MSEITIRAGDPGDPNVLTLIEALDAYLDGLYPPESNHGLSLAELQAADVRFVIAEQDGRPVGCGAIRLAADHADLKRMYVLPEARGAGVGGALLEHLARLAVAEERRLLRLEVGVAQPEALSLYAANGVVGGAGERPFLMAEQLRKQEIAGYRRAVQSDERA